MTIRPATTDDIEGAVTLWRTLQEEHEGIEERLRRSRDAEVRWRNDFRVWVRSHAHGIFVADDAGRLVGLITAHPYWPAPVYTPREEAYVNELVVLPGWRQRGLGRGLVEAVRTWARQRGIEQIRAGVLSVNPEALAFWRRVGASDFFVTVTIRS
jgi:GNAT superfamily N-acetyltransferase